MESGIESQSGSTGKATDPRLANLRPWKPGQSGNPAGMKSYRQRHAEMVDSLIADLGGNVGPIDRILVGQAADLLLRAQRIQRRRHDNTTPAFERR